MDPRDIIIYGVGTAGCLYFVWNTIVKPAYAKLKVSGEQKTAAILANTAALEQVRSELSAINGKLGGFELMPGLVRVCDAQVMEISKLREVVAKFAAVVVREPEAESDVVEKYDEHDADRAYAKGQYMAQGMSPDEAELRVDSDEAVASVWKSTPGVE